MVTKCSCERVVCLTCRHPEDHSCEYDYRNDQQKKLEKENPVVIGTKLDKL